MLKDLSGLVLIGMKVCLHPTVSLSFAQFAIEYQQFSDCSYIFCLITKPTTKSGHLFCGLMAACCLSCCFSKQECRNCMTYCTWKIFSQKRKFMGVYLNFETIRKFWINLEEFESLIISISFHICYLLIIIDFTIVIYGKW